jgi:hypothetical protein
MPRVLQHVEKKRADLARTANRARMVALGEDRAAATHEPVEATRNPDRESLNAARESARAICLCNDVYVRPLHGELDDAEAEAVAAELEGGPQGARCARGAEVPHVRREAEGDVDRVVSGDARARDVGDARGRAALPARAGTGATPTAKDEGELRGRRTAAAPRGRRRLRRLRRA